MHRALSGVLLLLALRCGSSVRLGGAQHDTEDLLQRVFTDLTDPSVYDKNVRPFPNGDGPVTVRTRAYVYYIGDIDAQNSEFFVQLLLRQRWNDPRLKYNGSTSCIKGEEGHKLRMWLPTIYLVNQKDAKIIDVSNTNVFVRVCPDGDVIYSYRIKSTLFCNMMLKKFPFDNQTCSVLLESWQYPISDMDMTWEETLPFSTNDLSLSEYSLTDIQVTNTSFQFPEMTVFREIHDEESRSQTNAESKYSRLVLDFFMYREPGYYLLDYYIPSGFLVIVSWVSFWLSPEAAPARVTLGTSTMLTFITLSNSIKTSLPKVSYTKFVDVWLFICTTFIFLSLVEFAFVNTIYRRKKNVTMKKMTTKHVLKSTIGRSSSRDSLTGTRHGGAINFGLSQSCSVLDNITTSDTMLVPPSASVPPTPTVFFVGDADGDCSGGQDANGLRKRDIHQLSGDTPRTSGAEPAPEPPRRFSMRRPSVFPRPFVEMTPPQIAKWIDKRSRWLFPLCFLAVNIVYWIFIVI